MGGSGMAMFGINIPIESIENKTSQIDGHVDSVLKRNDERKVFKQFLEAKTSNEHIILDQIIKSTVLEAKELLLNDTEVPSDVLFNFAVASLKNKSSGNLSLYGSILRKIIEDQNPKFIALHKSIDKNKFDGSTPFGYPDASKKAQGILNAKIRDTLPKVKLEYIEQKLILEKIRELSRSMFLGINKLNLSGEKLVNYLKVIYELSTTQTAPLENFNLLSQYLANGFLCNQTLEFYFIKCLRFTYPKGNSLKIVTHLGYENIVDKYGGTFLTTDESEMSDSMNKFKRIFDNSGLNIKLTVVIADNDLQDNFPKNFGDLIPISDIEKADEATEIYIHNLQLNTNNIDVIRITRLIADMGKIDDYEKIRKIVLDSLKRGDSKYVPEKTIEGLVEYRFERDCAIFEKSTKEIARERVFQKMASQIAIQVLASEGKILLTNSHGNENKLIAGGQMPIIFTDFYHEQKVFKNV